MNSQIKKIVKHTVNICGILNGLWLVIAPIWHVPYQMEISATLVGICAVGSAVLEGKFFFKPEDVATSYIIYEEELPKEESQEEETIEE